MNALLRLAGLLALTTQLELATHEPRAEFITHNRVPRHMTFSPDSEKLAVAAAKYDPGSWVGTILSLLKSGGGGGREGCDSWRLTVLDAGTGKILAELDPERIRGNGICAMSFSPDGRSLAVGGYGHHDNFVSLCDLSGPQLTEKASYRWHRGKYDWEAFSLAFSADGKSLVAVGGACLVWDVTTKRDKPVVLRHEKELICGAAFSLDGKRLATTASNPRALLPGLFEELDVSDGAIRIWDVTTGQGIREVDTGEFVAFNPEFTDKGNAITYWTVVPLTVVPSSVVPDKSKVLDKSKEGFRLRKWIVDGDAARPVAAEDREIEAANFGLLTTMIGGLFSNQPGKIDFVGTPDGEVVVRDVVAGKELARFNPGHGKGALLHEQSPDGKTLVTGSSKSDRVRLWSVADLLKLQREG